MKNFSKILISIDPAISCGHNSDETGIIVMGKTLTQHGVILNDLSGQYAPEEWAKRAVDAYKHYQAHLIVAEINQGGDMVEHILKTQTPLIRFKALRAKASKYERAIPVSALYRQGRIYHLQKFKELEDQLLNLSPYPKHSPDRADALVWGIRELFFEGSSPQEKFGMTYI